MSKSYWMDLIRNVSQHNSLKPLMEAQPMSAVDTGFTRPLIPFNCGKKCGKGTKRTPSRSCAIDLEKFGKDYNWFWKHDILV
jgi:hypothetical protein